MEGTDDSHVISPTDATDSLQELAQSGQALIESMLGELPVSGLDPATLFAALTATPEARSRLAGLQSEYYRDWLALWSDGAPASFDETDRDPRFEAPEWRESPWFRLLRGTYELNRRYLSGLADVAALEAPVKRRLRFDNVWRNLMNLNRAQFDQSIRLQAFQQILIDKREHFYLCIDNTFEVLFSLFNVSLQDLEGATDQVDPRIIVCIRIIQRK